MLQALLAVADTCSNTGCLTPEEALQVARERYELACGRLQGMHSKARGDSPRSPAETGSAGGSSRASPRASRPGAFAGVSKLTAQQRRARHRCNNPWSVYTPCSMYFHAEFPPVCTATWVPLKLPARLPCKGRQVLCTQPGTH